VSGRNAFSGLMEWKMIMIIYFCMIIYLPLACEIMEEMPFHDKNIAQMQLSRKSDS
jgi:hypothetical protein